MIKEVFRATLRHDNYRGHCLHMRAYKVVRETKCGVWIDIGYKLKWISLHARNKFACQTEKEAYKQYIRRKSYRNHCIEFELDRNNATIIAAKEIIKNYDKQGKKQDTKRHR